jgi:hypothetical protein
MRNRIYLLFAALLLFSIQLQAQTLGGRAAKELAKMNKHEVNGIVATFSPFTEGRATAEGIVRICRTSEGDENTIGCGMINPSTGTYIVYLLVIERQPEPTKLKITIKPAPLDFTEETDPTKVSKALEIFWPTKRGYTRASPPSYPEPIVIKMTDVIKIPLWVNAGTEWGMIGDEIRFAFAKERPPEPAHDFTLDDLKFKLAGFRLIINGEARSGESNDLDLEGPLPSFYAPGKGLFILSIRPREGHNFQKIGVAEGNKISFSYGGDKYEWVSREPVIAQGGKWNIWVMHDSDSRPIPEKVELYKLLSKGNCCVFHSFEVGDLSKFSPQKK